MRELEREIVKQEKEQAKIAAEIKKHAKSGQVSSAKTLAKSYVRTKNFITKFIMMKTQLKGISLQMQTIKSSHAMGDAMPRRSSRSTSSSTCQSPAGAGAAAAVGAADGASGGQGTELVQPPIWEPRAVIQKWAKPPLCSSFGRQQAQAQANAECLD